MEKTCSSYSGSLRILTGRCVVELFLLEVPAALRRRLEHLPLQFLLDAGKVLVAQSAHQFHLWNVIRKRNCEGVMKAR